MWLARASVATKECQRTSQVTRDGNNMLAIPATWEAAAGGLQVPDIQVEVREDLQEPVRSFYHVSLRDRTQAMGLGASAFTG